MRRVSHRPSIANSTHAATSPGDSAMPGSRVDTSRPRPSSGPSSSSSVDGRDGVAGQQRVALVEPLDQPGEDGADVAAAEVGPPGVGGRAPGEQLQGLLLLALLADVELDLAAQGRHHAGEVADARDRVVLAREGRPSHGRAGEGLDAGDGEPGGHAAALVDGRGLAHLAGEAGDDVEQVAGHDRVDARLLPDELGLGLEADGVVGADLGAEAVLQRGDDPAAVGVVLRVRAGDDEQVQGEAQLVAAHLDVALLEDVEQGDLDALGEVGQLVDGEDPAVGARDQAVVDGLAVAEAAALRDLDRVDVADEVADRRVGSGELLAEALAAVPPADRQQVAELAGEAPAARADRRRRVVVDLAALDDGDPLVEQGGQRADEPGLALPALAEEDDVVPGEQGALELGADGLLEADDAGEGRLPGPQPVDEVRADLGLDAARLVPRGQQGGEVGRQVGGHGRSEGGHEATLRPTRPVREGISRQRTRTPLVECADVGVSRGTRTPTTARSTNGGGETGQVVGLGRGDDAGRELRWRHRRHRARRAAEQLGRVRRRDRAQGVVEEHLGLAGRDGHLA